jgi:hypothetical protein
MSHLRNALQRIKEGVDPLGNQLVLERHVALRDVVSTMGLAADVHLKAPGDLNELFARIAMALHAQTLSSLSLKDKREVPFIFNWQIEGVSLCERTEVLEWYLEYFRDTDKARDVRRLIFGYFATFKNRSKLSEDVARAIVDALGRIDSQSLEPWRSRHARFQLFSPGAVQATAAAYTRSQAQVHEFLHDLGDLEPASPFLHECSFAIAADVAVQVSKPNLGARAVERLKAWWIDGGKLRYDDVRSLGRLANEILSPWMERDPADDIQAQLLEFFLRYYGHPRLKPGQWQYADEAAQSTIMRWNARSTIEDFFKILDASAPVEQWSYRSAFWLSYVNRNHVFEAWPVFGRAATSKAKRLFSGTARDGQYGELTGASFDQSVLLIKIDNLTIVEWSHNGQCWIMTSSRHAPSFYREAYSASELRGFSSASVRHDGKERGTWQAEVQQRIFENTGIRMSAADYMPRTHDRYRS